MEQESKKVGFVVGCVDFRHHKSEAEVISQLEAALGVDEVYFCTTAGPDGKVLQKGHSYHAITEDAVTIRDAKGASVFAVLGHYGCAGHNVPNQQHDADTVAAAKLLAVAVEQEAFALIFAPSPLERPTWQIENLGVQQPEAAAVVVA